MDKNFIRLLRVTNGLSQREFAQKVGLSHGMVGFLETGDRKITLKTERKIKDAFGITEDKMDALLRLLKVAK
jgi:transcriptional regulator with XRE-family HTH domain